MGLGRGFSRLQNEVHHASRRHRREADSLRGRSCRGDSQSSARDAGPSRHPMAASGSLGGPGGGAPSSRPSDRLSGEPRSTKPRSAVPGQSGGGCASRSTCPSPITFRTKVWCPFSKPAGSITRSLATPSHLQVLRMSHLAQELGMNGWSQTVAYGPGSAMGLHVAACMPHLTKAYDLVGPYCWIDTLVNEPFVLEDGSYTVPGPPRSRLHA